MLTFASGPTNSMRGAAFLSGVGEAIVVDIGGTTSDVGSLQKGFPAPGDGRSRSGRRAHQFPHARRVLDRPRRRFASSSMTDEGIKVGPTSVGYRIKSEALIFGGSTLDHDRRHGCRRQRRPRRQVARSPISARTCSTARKRRSLDMLEDCVERSRLSPDPLPVIVVGGGSILVNRADRRAAR